MRNEDDLKSEGDLQQILARDGFSPDLPEALRGGRTPWRLRVLLHMLKGLRIGSLDVVLPNGESRSFLGAQPGPHGLLRLHSDKLIRQVLAGGEVGFGEAYLDGHWDSPDLAKLLAVLHLNEPHYQGPYEKNWLGRAWGWLQHRQRANTKDGARANIEHHYDLGNAFYKLWLDETLAYSSAVFSRPDESSDATSAVFSRPDESLQDAQLNKFRLMYERLDLRPGQHLLEIGSGWGGFAIYAARRSGCRVTSLTLSREQLAEARLRAAQAGVDALVNFELRDYRDIRDTYDRVVSIEMYEAVGERYWPDYFRTLHAALKPGGRAAIQGITISEKLFPQYRVKRDFIQKYIFPGGMLCPPTLFQQLAAQAGLQPQDARYYARDYADTLAHWQRNVAAVREDIERMFDARFLRLWRYYLAYCECGFRSGSIDLMQITLTKA